MECWNGGKVEWWNGGKIGRLEGGKVGKLERNMCRISLIGKKENMDFSPVPVPNENPLR